MTSLRAFVAGALFVVACSSDSSDSSSAAGSSGFDPSKGWRIVQIVTNDDDAIGEGRNGRIELCGLDVTPDAHVKVFYWQGWQSQQEFLYRATRLDELDASGNRTQRTELAFLNELFNERFPEGGCHLRGGKATALRTTGGHGYGISWEVYENDRLASASTAVAGEFIGRTKYVGDDAIVFGDTAPDPNNRRTVFTLKQYGPSGWEYFDKGALTEGGGAVGAVQLIGGGRVGDAVYAVLVSIDEAKPDESHLWVQRFDGTVWMPAFDGVIPLAGESDVAYLRSEPRPLVALSSGAGSHVYEIDVVAKTITARATIAQQMNPKGWAVVKDDLYAAYEAGGKVAVGKANGSSLDLVGQPGFATGAGGVQLFGRSGRLYAVVTNALIQHEQLIIATPNP